MTTPDVLVPQSTAPINRNASLVLKWGFRLTAALLALGIGVSLVRGDDVPEKATAIGDLFSALADGEGVAIITLAILTMIATPVVTTLIVAVGFMRLGDRRYGKVSFAVLTVLMISVIAALLRQ